jgi:hypothetical protein
MEIRQRARLTPTKVRGNSTEHVHAPEENIIPIGKTIVGIGKAVAPCTKRNEKSEKGEDLSSLG